MTTTSNNGTIKLLGVINVKKKYILFIFLLSMILISCGNDTEIYKEGTDEIEIVTSDAVFIKDLEKSVTLRWKLEDENDEMNTLTDEEYYDKLEELIDAEKGILLKYKESDFKDPKLKKLANDYINGVEKQGESMNYYFANQQKFTESWTHGGNIRSVSLTKLVDEYGVTVDEQVMKQLRQTAQLIEDDNKTSKEVEAMAKNIEFELESNEGTWKEYKAVVENTTEIDFSYFELSIKLIDKDGVTIDTTFDNTENWNSGEKVRFEFMTDKEFNKIEWQWNYYTD